MTWCSSTLRDTRVSAWRSAPACARSKSGDRRTGRRYLKVLSERFELIERRQPIFAKPSAKRGRYYLTDNFLRAWLAALANSIQALNFAPVPRLIEQADERLAVVEGHSLEKLVAAIYEERSRKNLGDFPLTSRIQGFWDRAGTEIDLVEAQCGAAGIRYSDA